MIVVLALVVLAALALVFMFRVARGHAKPADPQRLSQAIRAVDVEAFRNLIDPSEEDFLRKSLAPAQYRAVQRQRLRAAVEYVSCAAQNAAILVAVGDAARRSPDPTIAAAGEKLVDSAVRLRLYAFQAKGKLYIGILLPGTRISPSALVENYERMTGLVFQLSRLEYAARTGASSV